MSTLVCSEFGSVQLQIVCPKAIRWPHFPRRQCNRSVIRRTHKTVARLDRAVDQDPVKLNRPERPWTRTSFDPPSIESTRCPARSGLPAFENDNVATPHLRLRHRVVLQAVHEGSRRTRHEEFGEVDGIGIEVIDRSGEPGNSLLDSSSTRSGASRIRIVNGRRFQRLDGDATGEPTLIIHPFGAASPRRSAAAEATRT